ncbi:hypothetical protein AB0929_16215 [Streptomyces massasporeus]
MNQWRGPGWPAAAELGAAAHRICPCSKATRGNIPVIVTAVAG